MDDKRDFLFRFIPLEKRKGLLLDDEAFYSVTDQYTADKISKDILKNIPNIKVVTDGTACVGGNTYSFSKYFEKVHAVEIDPLRCSYLQKNLELLDVANADVHLGSILETCPQLQQDMLFLDPPWGGPNYKSKKKIDLYLSDLELSHVCNSLAPYTTYIALKVPTNFNIDLFQQKTKDTLYMVHKNTDLRKMNLLVYQKI